MPEMIVCEMSKVCDSKSKSRSTHLFALLVNMDAEGGVLSSEAVERSREVGGLLADGLQRERDDGFRYEH